MNTNLQELHVQCAQFLYVRMLMSIWGNNGLRVKELLFESDRETSVSLVPSFFLPVSRDFCFASIFFPDSRNIKWSTITTFVTGPPFHQISYLRLVLSWFQSWTAVCKPAPFAACSNELPHLPEGTTSRVIKLTGLKLLSVCCLLVLLI